MTQPQNPYGNPQNQPPQHPQQPMGAQPAKQKKPWYKRPLIMIPLVVVVLIVIGMAANGGKTTDSAQNSQPSDSAQPAQENNAEQPNNGGGNVMQYVLETDGSPVNATYAGKGMNISQEQGVPSGWTKEIQFDNKWDAIGANLSGQLDGGGTVTCKMLWNGVVVAENQSSGDYAMVTCSPDNSKM